MTFSTFAIVCSLLLQPPGQGVDLIRSIERQQGGRHWIDQPTEPAKSPEESHACFEIEPGYRIELIAAEPIITDPVAIDFDHLGRMFVVEYTDYPVGPKDPAAQPLSQIVLLEDTDTDGRMDKRTVFAPQLKFCHSLMAFRNGILACTETQILYLADTNGDNVADQREVWFDGFLPAHPQMQIGCPRWGFDNWIYLTYGHGRWHAGGRDLNRKSQWTFRMSIFDFIRKRCSLRPFRVPGSSEIRSTTSDIDSSVPTATRL
jgi:glucose/arabinose dehydrogenase